MPYTNPWVGYLHRSFEQIKASLIATLQAKVPEVTDFSPNNILIIIVDMFAGVAEMLSLYIDNMAREAFIVTARRYDSMVKLAALVDYRIKAATPASADITITFDTPATANFTIPQGTVLTTANGIQFVVNQSQNFNAGVISVSIPVVQIQTILSTSLGTTDGTTNQVFSLPSGYVHDSLAVVINLELYTITQSFGRSKPTDRHFIVQVDSDGVAKAIFGDGTNGIVPPAGFSVLATYQLTLGPLGNVSANSITQLTGLVVPGISSYTASNPNAASGGSNYESLERIRVSAPLSLRTLDRAVTEQDYIDITRLAPGVAKAAVHFDCSKYIYLYIVPVNGGIASTVLLDYVNNWVEPRRMLTTFPSAIAAGESEVRLGITVMPRYLMDPVETEVDLRAALADFLSLDNQDINKPLRLSDLYAIMDAVAKVDYVNITHLSLNPYARPKNHLIQLDWVREVLYSTTTDHWRLVYTEILAVPYIRLFKNNQFLGNFIMAVEYNDGVIKFKVNPGPYTIGDEWEFYTYPINQDIALDDYTIPVYVDSMVTANVLTPSF